MAAASTQQPRRPAAACVILRSAQRACTEASSSSRGRGAAPRFDCCCRLRSEERWVDAVTKGSCSTQSRYFPRRESSHRSLTMISQSCVTGLCAPLTSAANVSCGEFSRVCRGDCAWRVPCFRDVPLPTVLPHSLIGTREKNHAIKPSSNRYQSHRGYGRPAHRSLQRRR